MRSTRASSGTDRRTADFRPSGFFALRTPLLPFSEILAWSESVFPLASPVDGPGSGEARQILVARLAASYRRPEVREALYLASPQLQDRLAQWLSGENAGRDERLVLTLAQYFLRMAGRPTPFGLFAGCSVGTMSQATEICLLSRDEYRRHTRIDMAYTCLLANALAADPRAREELTYRPNPTLYRAAGRLRYFEARPQGERLVQALSMVKPDEHLEAVLALADGGARISELAGAFRERFPEVEASEVGKYLDELVARQLLVPALVPTLTGTLPSVSLVNQASRVTALATETAALQHIHARLDEMDRNGLGLPLQSYQEVEREMRSLPVPDDTAHFLHVDLFKPAAIAELGPAIIKEMSQGIGILHRLMPATARPSMRLTEFAARFRLIFGEREVPLPLALDDELGAGYGFSRERNVGALPLLGGLAIRSSTDERTESWGRRERDLLHLATSAVAAGTSEIVLSAADIDRLSSREEPLPLPLAFGALCRVAAASGAAADRGDFQLLLAAVVGPSGVHSLGRFCYGDESLRSFVAAHLANEARLQPDAVFAEVVYLPEILHHGNALLRPTFGDHEIPYLGASGRPRRQQIPIAEILVSLLDDEFSLRWARNGARLIPRLSNAHAYSRAGTGLYRFLCDLQTQGVAGVLRWDWGPVAAAAFLPRVRYGRIVLSRARWLLSTEEVGVLREARRQEAAFAEAVRALQRLRRLPRFIAIEDDDLELPIDLENLVSAEVLVATITEGHGLAVVELFPGPDALLVQGPEGGFLHELVVPFLACSAREERHEPPAHRPSFHPQSFSPGSEWLYASFFAGPSTADQLLIDPLSRTIREFSARDLIRGWFFLRYESPTWHLRMRFHGDPACLQREVMPRLESLGQLLLGAEIIHRVQFDTYEREVERYGGPEGVELAEEIFHADSEAALDVLAHLAGDLGGDARWQMALMGMDYLLSFLGFDLPAKCFIADELRSAFAEEFKATSTLKRQIGKRFRGLRGAVQTLLRPGDTLPAVIASGEEIFKRRSLPLVALGARLRGLAEAGLLARKPEQLAGSYLHLQANRMLRSSHREQELVLYEFLYRLYSEHMARGSRTRAEAAYVSVSPRVDQDPPVRDG